MVKGFLARHKEISPCQPTGTSYARVKGFTKENVESFFDLLEKEFELFKFLPTRIYNVDETGLSIVQSKIRRNTSVAFNSPKTSQPFRCCGNIWQGLFKNSKCRVTHTSTLVF